MPRSWVRVPPPAYVVRLSSDLRSARCTIRSTSEIERPLQRCWSCETLATRSRCPLETTRAMTSSSTMESGSIDSSARRYGCGVARSDSVPPARITTTRTRSRHSVTVAGRWICRGTAGVYLIPIEGLPQEEASLRLTRPLDRLRGRIRMASDFEIARVRCAVAVAATPAPRASSGARGSSA